MTKITVRLIGLFVLAFSLGLLTLLSVRVLWFQPAQISATDQLDRAQLERYRLLLNAEHSLLTEKAKRLTPDDLSAPNNNASRWYNVAWLLDADQKLVAAWGIDPNSGNRITEDRLTLLLSQLLNGLDSEKNSALSWFNTPSGPAMIVDTHTATGYRAIALQLWTATRIDVWESEQGENARVIWLHDKNTQANLRRAAAALEPYQQRSPVRASGMLRWVINDIDGNPLMLWEVKAETSPPLGLGNAQLMLLVGWVLALTLLAVLVHRQFITPVKSLKQALQQRNLESDYHHPVTLNGNSFGLVRECNQFLAHIQLQDNKLLKLSHQVELLSKTDTLTGLANRQRLEEFLAQEWARASQLGTNLCFGVCDLDMFKSFNERYGVAMGDTALKEVARTLEGNLHRATDLVARLSGATFAIVLTDTDKPGAQVVGEKLIQAIIQLQIANVDSEHKVLTISVGCVPAVPQGPCVIEKLLSQANTTLQKAKKQGGNRVSVTSYEP
ncbi:GGDEF domain-containing protein [Corallincola platygyrae]|uniref:diguanylate cyclase n=1 Tax=Corallincola platygyrae TaxID=1193278 RepID=A0ABW4XI80_9GAMM